MTSAKVSSDRAIGYVRVSTDDQAESGLGLAAQVAAIEAEAARRGWTLVGIETDAGLSGKALTGRPALEAALAALDAGKADVLLAAKLDRVSRSVVDTGLILERAKRKGWQLLTCDLAIDMTSPMGEAMANVAATFAQLERRLISERTKAALAAKRAQGVRLGRPRVMAEGVRARIVAERAAGRSLAAIADGLTAEGVPTAQGGARWYPSTISKALAA